MVAAPKERRSNRSPEEVVAALQAKIEAVKSRAERKALNADSGRRQARLGLAALRRAVTSTEDATLRAALEPIVAQVERALGVAAVPAAKPRRRARSSEAAS